MSILYYDDKPKINVISLFYDSLYNIFEGSGKMQKTRNKDSQKIHYGFLLMMVICFIAKDKSPIFIYLGYFFGSIGLYCARIDYKFTNVKKYNRLKYTGIILIIYTSIQLLMSIFSVVS